MPGVSPDRNLARIEGAVDLPLGHHWDLFASYKGELGNRTDNQSVDAGLSFVW